MGAGASCSSAKAAAALEPSTVISRVLLLGPPDSGKSLLQQKLLLDTPFSPSVPVVEDLYSMERDDDDGFTGGSQHIRAGVIATGLSQDAPPCIRFSQVFDIPACELERHLENAQQQSTNEAKSGGEEEKEAKDNKGSYAGSYVVWGSKKMDAVVEGESGEVSERRPPRVSSVDDPATSRRVSRQVLAKTSKTSLEDKHPFLALLQSCHYVLLVFDASDKTGESLREMQLLYAEVIPYLYTLKGGKTLVIASKVDLLDQEVGSSESAAVIREAAEWAQERGSRVFEVSGLTGAGVRKLRARLV